MDIPQTLHSQSRIKRSDIQKLGAALQAHNVSFHTRLLLAGKASTPPRVRLMENLRTVLIFMSENERMRNVLRDGLTHEEQQALMELDLKGLDIKDREVAHGLLDVHERWVLIKVFRRKFHTAHGMNNEFISDIEIEENK